jgi:galactokinase
MDLAESVKEEFKQISDSTPLIVRSPGRINLSGEHTDYDDGFVLAATIDTTLYFAIAPQDDSIIRLVVLNVSRNFECPVHEVHRTSKVWPSETTIISKRKIPNIFHFTKNRSDGFRKHPDRCYDQK